MKKVRITAVRVARYDDLIEKYENPIAHACAVSEGQTWVANGWNRPEGFCDSAWDSVSPFVMTLACGGEDIYDGWMKNAKTASTDTMRYAVLEDCFSGWPKKQIKYTRRMNEQSAPLDLFSSFSNIRKTAPLYGPDWNDRLFYAICYTSFIK